jgi:hypothetical protein
MCELAHTPGDEKLDAANEEVPPAREHKQPDHGQRPLPMLA